MGSWLFPLSMRHPPRTGPAARRLVPVHWGLLALVAGAHAAGIGLLAGAGAPPPRESPRRPAETAITARLFAPPAATEGASPAPPAGHPAPQAPHPPPALELRAAPAATIGPAPAPSADAVSPLRSKRAPVPAPKPAAARKRREPPQSASPSALTGIAPAALAEQAGQQPAPVEPPSPPPAAAVASTPATVPDAAAAAGNSTGTGSGATTTADDGEAMTTAAHYDADYLDNPAPAYPAASRRLGEQGTVLLRVRVMHDGRPQTIEVLAGSGSPRLDRAATEAVRRWRFVPATQHGASVDSWLRVPIVFRLED